MATDTFSKEFTAYAFAEGRTPDEQLKHDEVAFPGGCMCGFIAWMGKRLAEFKQAHPEACIGHNIRDHRAKCRFLMEWAAKHRSADIMMRAALAPIAKEGYSAVLILPPVPGEIVPKSIVTYGERWSLSFIQGKGGYALYSSQEGSRLRKECLELELFVETNLSQ